MVYRLHMPPREAACSTMYERYEMGLPPEHIYLKDRTARAPPERPFLGA